MMTKDELLEQAELIETAWGVIANAHNGDWGQARIEWRQAAERWRDNYHEMLESLDTPPDTVEAPLA